MHNELGVRENFPERRLVNSLAVLARLNDSDNHGKLNMLDGDCVETVGGLINVIWLGSRMMLRHYLFNLIQFVSRQMHFEQWPNITIHSWECLENLENGQRMIFFKLFCVM